MSETISSLTHVQLDALREIANIGAGHAATALSQMMNTRIMISIPELRVTWRAELVRETADREVVSVSIGMLGDLTGQTLLVFGPADAFALVDSLMMRAPGATQAFGELERSVISEVGNILASAYMNALANFMELRVLPSPPRLDFGPEDRILDSQAAHVDVYDPVLEINTQFRRSADEPPVAGTFLLLPHPSALERILGRFQLL